MMITQSSTGDRLFADGAAPILSGEHSFKLRWLHAIAEFYIIEMSLFFIVWVAVPVALRLKHALSTTVFVAGAFQPESVGHTALFARTVINSAMINGGVTHGGSFIVVD